MSNYGLDNVKAAFLTVPLGGYGQGGALKITKKDADYDVQAGVGGDAVFWRKGNDIYEIEVTVLQTSIVNALLSAILIADKASTNGAGIGPFIVTDLGGNSLFAAGQARIMGPPDTEFTNEPKDRVWKIVALDGKNFVGGNP
jgi:hypothetical protein